MPIYKRLSLIHRRMNEIQLAEPFYQYGLDVSAGCGYIHKAVEQAPYMHQLQLELALEYCRNNQSASALQLQPLPVS